jgi:deoxyribodipyrimidine photo-lyase
LAALAESLAALGAPLVWLPGQPEEALPALARETGAGLVVWNRLYEPYSRDLDGRVTAALDRDGVEWRSFAAGLLFEPGDLVANSGRPFVQFTPFWRHCLALREPEPPLAAAGPLKAAGGSARGAMPLGCAATSGGAAARAGWQPDPGLSDWQPGEAGAKRRLDEFVDCCLSGYESGRDLLGIEGTSRMSPHLHFGEVGPRQAWQAARAVHLGRTGGAAGEAAAPFLRQLIWREFAHYILYHFPRIAEQPFRPEFELFPWQDDPAGLEAWQWGATGYPLVDASARQLLSTGWVHNRARLVSASFLTKDLLIPWQHGAAWYWDHLVDADLANNTLGWQWTAGSGPDAAPYFRVFNPTLQARRFDPEGLYAARWAAEMAGVPAAYATTGTLPIVDHAEARARALAAFRGMRDRAATRHLSVYPLPTDMQV